ncbi:MAG: YggS family pyridoxal phosphate-dependent enzyme [Oscillospiraceae bacterium]|nr:YggS family pyridoxal phosphate-dependent enzyme [Oscillospiraceae bacterium]MDD6083087.1 YggS family pyridoxal phosphate-dependent enzyme [Oscillospiraceae bacterium]
MSTQFDYVEENFRKISFRVNEAKEKYGRSGDIVEIMAVTKTVAPEIVNHAVSSCGIKLLGENRVQEYLSKKDSYLPASVHFIGQLQSNKVKYIIDSVDMIHSVDSIKLAKEIDRHAQRIGKIQDVLVEVNIAGEESKGGVSPGELTDVLAQAAELPNIKVQGLMTIPPAVNSEKFLYEMQKLYIDISDKKIDNINMSFLSMGMSGDYETAVKYGSNILRIGSALFGARIYK